MSENIKPSEVSEVLLQQLKGINTHLQFDEVGNVLQVRSLKTVSWLS